MKSSQDNVDNNTARSAIAVDRADFVFDNFLKMATQQIDDEIQNILNRKAGSRSEYSAIFKSDDFFLVSSNDDIDRKIQISTKIHMHKRRQRSENFRQAFVLFWFLIVTAFTIFALLTAGWVLLFQGEGANVERAKWLCETVLGGFVAGIIGFAAIKSFEK